MMSGLFRLVGFAWVAGVCCTANADLVISMNVLGGGTEVSVTGSGTLTGGPGPQLGFLNFAGNPFADSFAETSGTGAGISFTFANGTQMVSTMELVNSGTSGDDLFFQLPNSPGNSGAYSASGSLFFAGLDLSALNVGSYTASTSVGDAADFGGVTLNIVSAVPEPSALAMLCVAGCVVFTRRRRACV